MSEEPALDVKPHWSWASARQLARLLVLAGLLFEVVVLAALGYGLLLPPDVLLAAGIVGFGVLIALFFGRSLQFTLQRLLGFMAAVSALLAVLTVSTRSTLRECQAVEALGRLGATARFSGPGSTYDLFPSLILHSGSRASVVYDKNSTDDLFPSSIFHGSGVDSEARRRMRFARVYHIDFNEDRFITIGTSMHSRFNDAVLIEAGPLLAALDQLRELRLGGVNIHNGQIDRLNTDITDRGLGAISDLPRLEALDLTGTGVTGAALESCNYPRLNRLTLEHSYFSDQYAASLRRFPRLERLSLQGTGVSDAALEHIGQLKQLKRLWLNHTKITDAGLVHLAALTQLKDLGLAATGATPEGVAALERKLPRTKIFYRP